MSGHTTGVRAEYRCPNCGSDDTASLRSVYEHGSGFTSSEFVGVSGHHAFVGGASGRTTSYAARRAAPPVKASREVPQIMVVVGFGLLAWAIYSIHTSDVPPGSTVVLTLLAIVLLGGLGVFGCWLLWDFGRYNRTGYLDDLRRWNETWACQRCGEPFVPASMRQAHSGVWRVEAVDRLTGKDIVWNCHSDTEVNARQMANARGLLVKQITPS